MAKDRRWKRMGWIALGLVVACGLFGFETNREVLASADGRVFTEVARVPTRDVALVLGTSPRYHGRKNPFFERRMDAAAKLYRAGKVRKLLVSGDNGSRWYDEPTAMKAALVERGVPAGDVVADYAGFRTLDSVVRAKTVFGLRECTIVTDDFHLPRALYIASQRGLDAVGYQTEPLPRGVSPRTFQREVGARALIWIELHLLNKQPRFAGPPEPITPASVR